MRTMLAVKSPAHAPILSGCAAGVPFCMRVCRTVPQAQQLSRVTDIQLALNLSLRHEVLVEKCCGRRICAHCGKNYNIADIYLPATGDRCAGLHGHLVAYLRLHIVAWSTAREGLAASSTCVHIVQQQRIGSLGCAESAQGVAVTLFVQSSPCILLPLVLCQHAGLRSSCLPCRHPLSVPLT